MYISSYINVKYEWFYSNSEWIWWLKDPSLQFWKEFKWDKYEVAFAECQNLYGIIEESATVVLSFLER